MQDMEFEFDILGDLSLSEDENSSSQVAMQAYELELQQQPKSVFSGWYGGTAEQFHGFLGDLICELQPTPDDYLVRVDILNRLSNVISSMDLFRGTTISTFGSFESNFFTHWADLDLSLELPQRSILLEPIGKKLKVKVLRCLWRMLVNRAEVQNAQFIPFARVPLLTFKDPRCRISCDISVDNGVAILKSRFLRWIGDVDPRCRDLIFLVKCWAKAHHINDPKTGTLNSFALCLLAVFHLQTRSPPLLPPLSTVLDEDIARNLKEGYAIREQLLSRLWERIQPFIVNKFGVQNKSSVAELFVSFFNQFSAVKELWLDGLVVCTYTGRWGDRTSTSSQWIRKRYVMAVEDPFDRKENCARSVQASTFQSIVNAFSSTANALSHPPLHLGLSSLLEVLFRWPVSVQAHGIRFWLSNMYSTESKTIQVKANEVHPSEGRNRIQREIRRSTSSHKNQPLEAFLESTLEAQYGKWMVDRETHQRKRKGKKKEDSSTVHVGDLGSDRWAAEVTEKNSLQSLSKTTSTNKASDINSLVGANTETLHQQDEIHKNLKERSSDGRTYCESPAVTNIADSTFQLEKGGNTTQAKKHLSGKGKKKEKTATQVINKASDVDCLVGANTETFYEQDEIHKNLKECSSDGRTHCEVSAVINITDSTFQLEKGGNSTQAKKHLSGKGNFINTGIRRAQSESLKNERIESSRNSRVNVQDGIARQSSNTPPETLKTVLQEQVDSVVEREMNRQNRRQRRHRRALNEHKHGFSLTANKVDFQTANIEFSKATAPDSGDHCSTERGTAVQRSQQQTLYQIPRAQRWTWKLKGEDKQIEAGKESSNNSMLAERVQSMKVSDTKTTTADEVS